MCSIYLSTLDFSSQSILTPIDLGQNHDSNVGRDNTGFAVVTDGAFPRATAKVFCQESSFIDDVKDFFKRIVEDISASCTKYKLELQATVSAEKLFSDIKYGSTDSLKKVVDTFTASMNEINREIDRLKRPDHRFDTKFQIGYSLTNMAQKYSSQLTDLDDHANLIFMEKQFREMKLIDSKQRANEDSLLSSKILSPVLEHMVEFQIAEKIKHAIRKCIPEGLVSALLAAGERETGIYVATGTVINKLKESLTICGIRAETVAMKLRRDEKIYLKEIFSKGYTYHNCEQLKLAVLSCWKKNEDDLDWEICSLIYNHLDTSQCVDN